MQRYTGLLGSNIKYSKSPDIHNKYYEENNIPLEYKLFDISQNKVSNFIKNLRINNIIGFNVTIPYKEEILAYLDKLEYPADRVKAVNTVVVCDEKLVGFNTDYYGFIKSLEVNNIDLNGKTALIIGNGGVSLCIYYALKDLGCECIDMCCRNAERNKELLQRVDNVFNIDDIIKYEKYDIIVNCTPLGGQNYLNYTPLNFKGNKFKKDLLLYDLNYSPEETLFLKEGKRLGFRTINGKQMLIFQAKEAIEIWKTYIDNGREQNT